jgi:membrane-associated phospholipid phosphatase
MTDAGLSPLASVDMARETRKLRMPTRSLLWVFLREGAWVSGLWFVVYGGANWLTGLHDYRVRLWTSADLAIPFVPAAAAIYLSIFPMFWISLLILHTREEFRSLAKAIAWLIVVSGIGFLLFPGDNAYPTQAPAGFVGMLYSFADGMNMTHNYLPSLHVGMAVVCAYVYSQSASRKLSAICWLWAAAIAVSTLLTHQHYLADGVIGGALGFLIATRTRPTPTELSA